ncbi:MAG: YfcC family protein [Clostridia bacterium]|nr:YfcC family protein [Clostridia bacterium]
MSDEKTNSGSGIGVRSFITALVILFVLMCATFALTFLLPAGEYDRVVNEDGVSVIDTESYRAATGDLPFWKWLLSPFLVLGAEGGGTILAVIAFLLVIGGVFSALEKSGMMQYVLQRIVHRWGGSRYRLLAMMIFFFMSMGAFIGSFEECVPLVPIVVALSVALGWDELTGLGMSLLAVGCGFASGVCNPFTVGVAQELAGLPMFSGVAMRLFIFAVIYLLVWLFVRRHAVRVERPIDGVTTQTTFVRDARRDRAMLIFALVLAVGVLLVLSSAFLKALQDYNMIIVAIMFLVAGVWSVLVAGMTARDLGACFLGGVVNVLPAVLMILMASSIKYTMTEAKILDSILHAALGVAESLPRGAVILFIYLIVLVMNFFISSGSAKAFLLIPLIMPLSEIFGISKQLSIVAFAFGDGFSNILYPTNPVLLISLGLAGVGYANGLSGPGDCN